jgi:hypothetical protein
MSALSLFAFFFQSILYIKIASGALLVYDYLCTLDLEVAYVWAGPWTLGTFLFILNRYLPFVDIFILIQLLAGNPSPETCVTYSKVATWFMVTGVIISEIILMLRTYALWECRRSILIALISNFFVRP